MSDPLRQPARNDVTHKLKDKYRTLQQLEKDSHFSRDEIHILQKVFCNRADKDRSKKTVNEPLQRSTFMRLAGLKESMFLDRLFKALDTRSEGLLFSTFVYAMSVILKGSVDELLLFCYRFYCLSEKNITTHDLFEMIKGHLDDKLEEDILAMMKVVLVKIGLKEDGKITLEEFKDIFRWRKPQLVQLLPRYFSWVVDRNLQFTNLNAWGNPARGARGIGSNANAAHSSSAGLGVPSSSTGSLLGPPRLSHPQMGHHSPQGAQAARPGSSQRPSSVNRSHNASGTQTKRPVGKAGPKKPKDEFIAQAAHFEYDPDIPVEVEGVAPPPTIAKASKKSERHVYDFS
eukprot:gnl/Spiro4/5084_TR2537_c0_g1_i1.p1 gnl/Spiro4/5084_TR2537_c0_g1~~gnl/Spiro4/5084_TR2537_c0_g1_i1.p1  ORF type:complete len:363 (+),score=89.28 gnl/Spiro4/5084_TR2537_c0_g1_i1:58-1089(+)